MRITVACAQFRPEKAAVSANLDRIAEIALQAAGEAVDILLFPETTTTGYFLEGGVLESSISAEDLRTELANRTQKLQIAIDVALGFYERHEGNIHNSVAYLELGPNRATVKHVYRKFFLPTYGVFDEERFVSRGHDLGVFESRFGKLGLLICEDVWHSILPTLSAVKGAQLLLVPAASPARGFKGEGIDNHERYRRLISALCEEHGIFCVNCQLVGFEGGKGFVGGSMIVDPSGQTIAEAPIGEEHLLIGSVDLDMVTVARAQSPLVSDLQSAWEDIRRLVAGEG